MEQNERLGILRKKLDLTLEKFGEKIGVTGSAVGNIEKGRRALTEQVVKSVVREFNVNEDWLRTGVGEMFIESKESHLSELAKQYALDDMEVKIVEAFLELSPDKRAAIKEYVSVLAKSFVEKSEEEIIQEKIDKEVEAYRRELEIEARVKEKSYLSDDTFEESENKKEAK
jgi:transcriptional regulator with XRE-family HTH domain